MIRIDAHQHFWDPARGDYGWLTPALPALHRPFGPADLAPHLRDAHIAGTLLVQAAPTEAETDYLLSLARAASWVKGVVGWVDLDAPDVAARIARRRTDPLFKGIRPMLQDLDDPAWILAPARAAGLAALEASGLVFDALVRPAQLASIAGLAGRHPRLSIIIDHGGKGPVGGGDAGEWRAAMTRLAALPNVACKLSGLLTEAAPAASEADLLARMLELYALFGPQRLVWGSDWPVLELAAPYRDWLALTERFLAPLGDQAAAAIMGGNAARIYGLEVG